MYLSGLFGAQGATLAKGVDEQVHQLAKNDIAVLDAAGLTLEDIVSGHVYLADMQDYNGMNTVYRQIF